MPAARSGRTGPALYGLVAALLALPAGHAATAAPLFDPLPRTAVGMNPLAMAVGDFDNDIRPDLAIANHDSNTVSILLGLGNGAFRDGVPLPVGDGPCAVMTADFNGDGDLDIAVVNQDSDDVSILLGRFDGSFEPETTYGVGTAPSSIAIGLFDADGVPDLAVTNAGSNDVSILLGNGTGAFDPETRFGAGSSPASVAAGDLDEDGLIDLAVANYGSGNASILIGNGDGTFAGPSNVAAGASPRAVALDHLDGDGHLDLVVVNTLPDVSIRLGNGDGTFGPDNRVVVGYGLFAVDSGDLDGDGDVDLLIVQSDGHFVLLGAGDGSFVPQPGFVLGSAPRGAALVDLDRDGNLDLAAANSVSDDVRVARGAGDGTFLLPSHLVEPNPTTFTTADFDEDGLPDLAIVFSLTDEVMIYPGLGQGRYGDGTGFSVGDGPGSILAADFNRDGDVDLLVGNSVIDDMSMLLGTGDGSFLPEFRVALGGASIYVVPGDFDDDGTIDLVSRKDGPAGSNDFVAVRLGRGDGTFDPATSYAVGDLPGPAVGDFNEDGRQDLVVGNYYSADISILLGDGNGNFGPETRLPVGESIGGLLVGDLNGDELDDLLFETPYPNTLDTMLGNGDGTFQPRHSFDGWSNPGYKVLGDFNGDGKLDLAIQHHYATTAVRLFIGNGNGTFKTAVGFPGDVDPSRIVSDDLDADGRLDLAVLHNGGRSVLPFLNQGNFTPVADATAPAAVECVSFAGGAIDGDGSASSDPDSWPGTHDDIIAFDWFEDFGLATQAYLGSGETLPVTLPLGTHALTLRVTDRHGAEDTDQVLSQIVDTTAPMILSAALDPSFLWPPNHRLIDVAATVSAVDACGPAGVVLQSLASDEMDDAPGMGDGATSNDVQSAALGTADLQMSLRAERDSGGTGRSYIAVYAASDPSGNVTTEMLSAIVPQDVGGVIEPLLLSTFEGAAGTILAWDAVPGAQFYNVARGEISNLQAGPTHYDLGPLTCIAAAVTQLDTVGWEDADLPPSGEAFVYLVEYDDGLRSGYGTESAAMARVPSSGGCP